MDISSRGAALGAVALLVLAAGAEPARAGLDEAAVTLHTEEGARLDLVSESKRSRALVLVFVSASCPCVRRYQDRIRDLAREFGPAGVKVLGVVSNAQETPSDVRRVYPRRDFDVPLVHDPGGRLAAAIGARSTPTVAILSPKAEVAFLGWFDNEREPGVDGRQAYVERALTAILAGSHAFQKRSPVYGCRITRRLFAEEGHAEGDGCAARPANP